MTFKEKIKELRNNNLFMQKTGIDILDIENGKATGEIKVEPWHLNVIGSVHGGIIFSLADTIAGSAASSHGNKMTTLDSNFYFLAPAIDVEKLIAKAEIIKRGRTITVVDVSVYSEKETLISKGTFSFYDLKEPLVK